MKDVVIFDDLKAPVASADASPVDDSADDDDDDIDVDDHFFGDRNSGEEYRMSSRTLDNKSMDMSNCNAVKTASLPPNSKLKKDFTSGTAFKVNVRNSLGRTHSVRNFFNRVVNQTGSGFRTLRRRAVVQASGINTRTIYSIGGGESKKCDDAIEERIAAWRKRFSEDGGKVPGVVGIRNHGNTCFMNAILQCLSYTDILAEYLVLDQYKSDLKRKRRLQALTAPLTKSRNGGLSMGSKGEVTEQLATMLKSLWSLQYDPEISIRFKSLVDKHASQYKGGRQHDAQEFLLWLLDQVHEDLNTASRRNKSHKRYKFQVKSGSSNANDSKSGASPDGAHPIDEAQQAADALDSYMKSNNSFVMDIFQAQFRSSLTCPSCQRQSNTFDPFLCVSLPIPQKQLLPIYVTVLYIDQCPRQVRLGLTVGANDSIGELRCTLSNDTGIPLGQLLLVEIDGLTFRRSFRDDQPVTDLKEAASKNPSCDMTNKTSTTSTGEKKKETESIAPPSLYCIEVPHQKQPCEDDGPFVAITWVNVLKEGPIEKRFGSPYTIQVSRTTEYADLQKLLMKEMASILHDDILISAQKVPLFKIRVVDDLVSNKESSAKEASENESEDKHLYLDSDVDMPLYSHAVDQALELCRISRSGVDSESESGPPIQVKFVLEWDAIVKSQIIADDKDVIEEHLSVKQVQSAPEEATSVSLQECFNLYTKAETLGQGNAWFCAACNRKQEVVKRMGLWSVPDVLVIHLKRFRQSMGSVQGGSSSGASSNGGTTIGAASKLTTMVQFPLERFDMSPNVDDKGNKQASKAENVKDGNECKDRGASQLKNGSNIMNGDNPDAPTLTRSDDSPRLETKESHRNGSSNGTTGALNILKEKCTPSAWRSSKDDNIKSVNGKDHGLVNGISQPEKDIQANDNALLLNSYQYDLYAVCNHHGNDLQGGHYTATCRNPTDGKWYSFDDVHTRTITKPEDEVVSEDAYILFYQKCTSFSSNSCVTDSRSPISSRKLKYLENKRLPMTQSKDHANGSLGESHWVYRMPDFNYKGKTTTPKTTQASSVATKTPASGKAKSTTTTAAASPAKSSSNIDKEKLKDIDEASSSEEGSDIKEEIDSCTNDNETFQRNSKGKYATLPAMPKRCLEADSSTKCDMKSSKFIRSSNETFKNHDISCKDDTIVEGREFEPKSIYKNSTSSLSASKKFQNQVKLDHRHTESDLELDSDIQRPIDKNDVD